VVERRVEVAPGVALHVVEHPGEGRTFLLVNGLASNLRMWDGVAERLAAGGHRVVAVDLRGHGRSDKPGGGYDMATVAADVAELIGALHLDRPWVAGQSWGGNVVLELAWRDPAVGQRDRLRRRRLDRARRPLPRLGELRATSSGRPPTAGMAASALERGLREAHPDWPESGSRGPWPASRCATTAPLAPWLTLEHPPQVLQGLVAKHRPSSRNPGDGPSAASAGPRPGGDGLGGTDASPPRHGAPPQP
jgi:pimeloyl-ACP methyl ester carboxylesterase